MITTPLGAFAPYNAFDKQCKDAIEIALLECDLLRTGEKWEELICKAKAALELCQKGNLEELSGKFYFRISLGYFYLKKYQEALQFLVLENMDRPLKITALCLKSRIYRGLNEPLKASFTVKEAHQHYLKNKNSVWLEKLISSEYLICENTLKEMANL